LATVAKRVGASPVQVAIAWQLARSPQMLPIPGTSSVEHLEENIAAAAIELSCDAHARTARGARAARRRPRPDRVGPRPVTLSGRYVGTAAAPGFTWSRTLRSSAPSWRCS